MEICFALLFFDFWFYHCHVWLHSNSGFKYHKVVFKGVLSYHIFAHPVMSSPLKLYILQAHHEWKASIAAATSHGHPMDFFLNCVLPISLGPYILRSHMTTTWLWFIIITLHVINDHSGYHFPWMRSPQVGEYKYTSFHE